MDKIPELAERIAIWDLDGDTKENIAVSMIDDVTTSIEYRSQMLLSALIATLWLLINATPVVIGAMLIAPIMRPIQGVSFAVATGNHKLFVRSLTLLIASIVASVALAIVVTWIIPLTEVTNEIASRTQPTLVDLGIAFASWLVAFLALGYKKMTAGLAWVAMAASLVPPLWVIWIWIAFGSWSIGRGSTLLFMTNLVAIIIGGIIIFYVFGFFPNQKSDLKRSIFNVGFILSILFLLGIPLTSSLVNITRNISNENTIRGITKSFLNDIDEKIRVESLDIESIAGARNISLSLKVPTEQLDQFTDEGKQQLTQDLAAALKKDVALDVNLIPITSVTAKQAKTLSPEEKIRQYVKLYLNDMYEWDISLLSTDYFTDSQRFTQLTLYTELKINNKIAFKNELLDHIQDQEDLVDILSLQRQENWTEPEKVREAKDDDMDIIRQSFDNFFSKRTSINNLDLIYVSGVTESERDKLLIALNLTSTESKAALEDKIEDRKNTLQEQFAKQVNIELVVEFLDSLSF